MAIISLLGYMGSGKSTYGRLLAEKLDYNFIDLDAFIEAKEMKSIKKIFENKGEVYFRKVESKYLKELLSSSRDTILSLGGGTPIHGDNMKIVNDFSESVYLNASVNTLFNYLKSARANRPLIKDLSDEELINFIAEHLEKRKQYYSTSNLSVVTDGKSIEEIVNELESLFK